jgi:SLT domain-containing protein
MADETLRFDIIGKDNASGAFSRVAASAKDMGGNMDVATRHALVLDEALKKQSTAARTSADATLAGARADKIYSDAMGVLSGRTIEAELALKREAAAAKKSGDAAAEAAAKNSVLADSMRKVSDSALLKPSARGSFIALMPALIPVAGGLAAGIGAVGVSFGAAAAGAGLFGLAAKSVISSIGPNLAKLQALSLRLAAATTPAAKKSAQDAIKALTLSWSKGYLNLIELYKNFQKQWQTATQAIAVPALTTWLGALTKGMPLLVTAVKPVADVFQLWGQMLKDNFSNPATMKNLQGMAAAFGRFSAGQLTLVGRAIADIAFGVFHLGHDLAASGADFGAAGTWFMNMGAGFLNWSKSDKARADVQGFMHYLHTEGPVVKGILQDLGTILPGIFAGASATGQLELGAISGFLGLIAGLPKGWQKPLTEAAGAMLLLSKTGVVSVGLKTAFPKEGAGKTALAASLGMRLLAGAFIVPAAVMIIGTIIPPDTNKQAAKDFKNQPDIIVKISDFFHVTGMGAWVDQYFSHPIRAWAETSLPHFLGVAASKIGDLLTKTIPMDALRMALSVTGTFGKLPGPLGAPFRKAHDAIAGELAAIQFKASHTFSAIQAGINAFHGKKVALTFGLNLPAGVSFPSRHIKGRAAGWRVPGYGGGDQYPALLEGGEAVVPKHLTPAVAPFLKAHGVPGFAAGGLAGPTFAGTFPSASVIRGDDSAMQQAISSIATAVKGLLHINRSAFTFASAGGPASFGVTRWAPLILRVLAMLGQSSANLGAVEHRMQQESGGNPFAINNWDSNAAAGDPSRGLMQTIGSTFARYRSWSLPNNIYNPEANIFAGLNYALHAYAGRSLSSVMLQPGGYDNGGWLPPGASIAVNKTGRPEQVIPPGGGELAGLLAEIADTLASIDANTASAPHLTGRAVTDTLNGAARSSAYASMYGSR